jgi:hypothetical protein
MKKGPEKGLVNFRKVPYKPKAQFFGNDSDLGILSKAWGN